MINIGFVMGFVGAAVGILIGILIFASVGGAVACPGDIGTPQQTPATAGIDANDDGDFEDSGDTAPVAASKNTGAQGHTECNNAKTTAWTVMGILPITLFFVLFRIFGGQ